MAQMNLALILSKLGWGSGFKLPIADEENQRLEKLLEKEQKRCLELRARITEEAKVKENLKQHLGRVTTEIGISRKLLESKQSTVDTEVNILALEERQEQNLEREIKRAKKHHAEIEARNESMDVELALRRAKIDNDRQQLLGVDTESEQFKDELEQKEHNISYVLQLTDMDQKAVMDFEMKYQKYGEQLAHIRLELDNTVKFTQTLDSQYERACAQYRRANKERIQTLDLWTRTLESLTKRDADIRQIGQEYALVVGACQRATDVVVRKQEILKVREANTTSVESQTYMMDRTLAELRSEIPKMVEFRHRITDEIVDQRVAITAARDAAKDARRQIKQLEEELRTSDHRILAAETELYDVKERSKEAESSVQSVETRMKQLEDMIVEEEKKEDELLKELDKMRKYHFQKSNEAAALTRKLFELNFEIRSNKVMHLNLRDRAKNDFLEVQKKKYAAYEVELRVIEVETKCNELASPKVSESASMSSYFTSETLGRLRVELNEVLKDKTLVSVQKSHLEDITRRISKEIQMDSRGRVNFESALLAVRQETGRIEIELGRTFKKLRQYEVEDVLMNLQYRKFKLATKEQRNKILSLEQQRLYLQMAAAERRVEIEEHKTLLRTKLHAINEDKTRRISQRNEVIGEVERRKKRYDIIMASLASTEDREKQDFTEAFLILQHAQERENTKREGDLWDNRVKEAETEVIALQNTVEVMIGSNRAFKESLQPIHESMEEGIMMQKLEHTQREAVVRKRKADKLQRELAKHCAKKQTEIYQLTQTMEMLASLAEDKKYELNAVMVEIANQKGKVERANRVAAKLARDLGNQSDFDKKLIEAELQLRCAREKFGFALQTLDRALAVEPKMRDAVSEYLRQNPLLTDVARRLSLHGKVTDSAPASGTATPQLCGRSGSRQRSTEMLYKRKQKFAVSEPASAFGSQSRIASPAGSMKSERALRGIDTRQLEEKLKELQHDSETSELLFQVPD